MDKSILESEFNEFYLESDYSDYYDSYDDYDYYDWYCCDFCSNIESDYKYIKSRETKYTKMIDLESFLSVERKRNLRISRLLGEDGEGKTTISDIVGKVTLI